MTNPSQFICVVSFSAIKSELGCIIKREITLKHVANESHVTIMAARGASNNFFDSDNLEEFLYFESSNHSESDSDNEDYDVDEETVEQEVLEQLQSCINVTNDCNDSSDSDSEELVAANDSLIPETVDALKEASKCTCNASLCVSVLGVDKVNQNRAQAESIRAIGKTEFDLMILSKLSVSLINSSSVSTVSHKSADRIKSRAAYMHEG